MSDYVLQRNLCIARERERERFIKSRSGETEQRGLDRRHNDGALAVDETRKRRGARLEDFGVRSRPQSRQRIERGEQQNRPGGIAVERAMEELQRLEQG